MTMSPKRERFKPTKIPNQEVFKQLGDPGTWAADDAAYKEKVMHADPAELPQAASSSDDDDDAG